MWSGLGRVGPFREPPGLSEGGTSGGWKHLRKQSGEVMRREKLSCMHCSEQGKDWGTAGNGTGQDSKVHLCRAWG